MDTIGLEQQCQLRNPQDKLAFALSYNAEAKSPQTAFWLSFFLGAFGVDRFYIGQYGIGALKLMTLGGFWLWAIVDLFLIAEAAKKHNRNLALTIRTTVEMASAALQAPPPPLPRTVRPA